MATHSIVRSPLAIAFGTLFAGFAGLSLLWEVHSFADVTLDHIQTVGALVGVIAAGHFTVVALRHKLLLWAFILGLAWCMGTIMTLMGAAGRGAEAIERRNGDAAHVNDSRKDALAELAKARTQRDALSEQFNHECGSGRQGKCNGLKFALDAADSHTRILQVRADNVAPEQIANVRLKHTARLLAFFWGVEQKRAEIGLELLWPVGWPLINELLAIAFFGMGFGHGKLKMPQLPRVRISRRRKFARRLGNSGNPSGNGRQAVEILPPISDAEIVMEALSRAKGPVSNEELADLMDCSPGEACKRVAGLNGKLRKQRSGRYVLISPVERKLEG